MKLLQSFMINHPMVEDARPFEFKRRWLQKTQILWIVLLTYALVGIGWLILALPISFPANWIMQSSPMQNYLDRLPEIWIDFIFFFINLILFTGGIYIVMALYTRFVEKRSLKALGFQATNKGKKFISGCMFGLLSIFLVAILMVGFTDSTFSTEKLALFGWEALPMVLLLLIPWGVQATSEEVLFRGWLTPHLGKKYGLLIAVGVSSLLFSFAHGLNPGFNLLGFLNLTLYGVFTAFYMLYEKSILGIAGHHIAWNWGQANVLGILVSGDDPVPASILGLQREGNSLLTGGDFGTEGSIITTLALILSLTIIFILQHRRDVEGPNRIKGYTL
jgi:membrane protease YdiL (CAAX protease family)